MVAAWRAKEVFDAGLLDRLLAVLAEAVEAAARLAPSVHRAASAAVAGEIEPAALVREQEALLSSLERVLELVNSWQSLNDVIAQLRRVLEEQEALHERIAPGTGRGLVPCVPPRAPRPAVDLRPEQPGRRRRTPPPAPRAPGWPCWRCSSSSSPRPRSLRAEEPREQGGRDAAAARAERDIEGKVQALQSSMRLLAEELERSGRAYEAGLLKAGLDHLAKADVGTAMREVLDALRLGQRQRARDRAARCWRALNRLLLILEDRNRDYTRNEILERLEAAREAARQKARELEQEEAALAQRIEEEAAAARSEAARRADGDPAAVASLREQQAALREEARATDPPT